MGKINLYELHLSDEIEKQLNNGFKINQFLNEFDKSKISKLAPASQRMEQITKCLCVDNILPDPIHSQRNLENAAIYPKSRHARYFGAWALDQFEHFSRRLKNTSVPLDESTIRTYKNDFLSILHSDFESGKAYDYVDEWYTAFPKGGYFNPARYLNLYPDEEGIAYSVAEHMLCGYNKPIIAGLLSYPTEQQFDHTFESNGGAFLVEYKTGTNIREILNSQVYDIGECVSEMVGEDESTSKKQKIFVTDEHDYGNGISGCAVLYDGFETDAHLALIGYVKNAITESIPMDKWKSTRLSIKSEPLRVTKGEIAIAEKNLAVSSRNPSFEIPSRPVQTEKLNEHLSPEEYRDKMLLQTESFNFI